MIYSSVDTLALEFTLDGYDIDVPLIPSGFAILPDSRQTQSQTLEPIDEDTPNEVNAHITERGTNGSLLIVTFQMLMPSAPTAILSVISAAAVNDLFAHTGEKIKAALSGDENEAQ